MKRIAVIGAGVSGLTTARILSEENRNRVVVYEKENTPGGLIRCMQVDGSLFHICGGHVFNSKRKDVLEWFWSHFNKQTEFVNANRNSAVFMQDGLVIPYPIENHVYYFNQHIRDCFERDLQRMEEQGQPMGNNFEEFLKLRFGETLYNLYFGPYNRKVWQCDLRTVPLSWLDGKLPMPSVEEMRYNNANKIEEKSFVHSSFYYEKQGGSQFLANRLAEGLDIRYNSHVNAIACKDGKVYMNGEEYDTLVFCGNIKHLVSVLSGVDVESYKQPVSQLQAHGTTAVFCEIDANPYTWIYQPSEEHRSHRIICTGNFSPSNNRKGKMTGTVEFTDKISVEDIKTDLNKMPLHPKYLTHYYSPYTYPVQDMHTRQLIHSLKDTLSKANIYFTGRFADWEYYNMDVAMGAAIDLCKQL